MSDTAVSTKAPTSDTRKVRRSASVSYTRAPEGVGGSAKSWCSESVARKLRWLRAHADRRGSRGGAPRPPGAVRRAAPGPPRDGVKHPVHDFLFTYYSFPPAKLTTWEPGWPESGTPEQLERLRPLARGIRTLLVATAGRPAHTGCFGLHEWAMVHGADETRHDVPLRLGRGHRRGRRVAPDRLLALRRLPLLHRHRTPAEHALARPRRPGGLRAAGLSARDDGPLQARLPAVADRRLGPGRRLLRARLRHPRGGHAGVAVRLRRPRLRTDPRSRRPRGRRLRRVAAGVRRSGPRPCASGWSTACDAVCSRPDD